jgi:hypothetical protein
MSFVKAFTGAKRFHTGGFPGMGPGEVPIIAKKGEVVGWPDQLAKAYGGGNHVASNVFNINVSGGGGTPEHNQDLAERIQRQLEPLAREMVGKELRNAIRPGGLLNAGLKK